MTDSEIFDMTERMLQYGGSFIQSLAICIRRADSVNKQKLLDAFPEYVEEYGPNSQFNLPSRY
jgi:hypothetical protein